MTEYIAECAIDSGDTITARRSSNRVELEPSSRTEVYLDPADARTFARGIFALTDEIDGGEVAETPKREPQVGDEVRVVRNAHEYEGDENVGRVGRLAEITPADEQSHRVEFPGDRYGWWCAEVELVDEPKPALADWERDLLEASEPAPARSSRAAYVEEARRLMDGTGADADHIIAVAQFLAAGE